jgi:glycosyltransferase involved in cell wall biosynthesis
LTLNLYIIGDKDYFGDINTFGIYKFNMMNSTELADLYKNKDIFLSLNAYDTFSISTAEAMASGLIPVITKQTGMSSFVFDDVNGYVVEYDNTDDLKLCIDKLLKKNSLDKEIIRNNTKAIYYKLNWQKVFEIYELLYESIH